VTAKLLTMPDVKERLNLLGFEPIGAPADILAKYIRDEMAKCGAIIKDAKIRIE